MAQSKLAGEDHGERNSPPPLTVDNVFEVMKNVHSENWWSFSVWLLNWDDINRIKRQYQTHEDRLRKTAEAYVEQDHKYPWRYLIHRLYYVGELQVADHILSYAEPLEDATLTVSALKTVVKGVKNIDRVIERITPQDDRISRIGTTGRSSWQERLYESYQTTEERLSHSLHYYCNTHPWASWRDIAQKLYDIRELEAADKAMAFIARDPTLTVDRVAELLKRLEGRKDLGGVKLTVKKVAEYLGVSYSVHHRLTTWDDLASHYIQHSPYSSWSHLYNGLHFEFCLNQQDLAEEVKEKYTQGPSEEKQLKACRRAIKKKGYIDQTVIQGMFYGFPRSGKSSLKQRLVGNRRQVTASTGVAEKIVRVQISRSAIHVSGTNWQEMDSVHDETSMVASEIYASQYASGATSVSRMESLVDGVKSFFTPTKKRQNKLQHSKPKEQASNKTLSQTSLDAPKQPEKLATTNAKSVNPLQIIGSSLESSKPSNSSLQQLLDDKPMTFYMTDAGGQPEFQELLPVLVSGPALFFLVFPVHKDLNQKCRVEYLSPTGESIVPFEASFTMLDALLQSLASIASVGGFTNVEGVKVLPKVVFVGTHKDQIESEEHLQRVDKRLQDKVKKTDAFQNGIIESASESSLILAVNNLAKNDDDVENVRAVVHRIGARHNDYQFRTPYPWMIFGVTLNHIPERVLTYDQCVEIGKKCGIKEKEDLDSALWFLHNHIGAIRHFQQIPTLQDVVIKDPQYIFDKITELIISTFTFEKVVIGAQNEFAKKGIFSREIFMKLASDSDPLTPDKLITLLQHLHIIAPLENEDGDIKYFIPCALKHADLPPTHLAASTVPSVYITFKTGYTPKGLFGSLVVHLISNKVQSEFKPWKLEHDTIYRDQLCLSVGPYADSFRFTLHPRYIRIDLVSLPGPNRRVSIGRVCSDVLRCIEHSIEEVIKSLNYTTKAAPIVAFTCPHQKEDEPLHLATVNTYKDEPCSMTCTQCEKTFDLPDGSIQCVWYKDMHIEPPPSASETGDSSTPTALQVQGVRLTTEQHYHKLFTFLSSHAHLWRRIGVELGFLPNELDVIQSNPILLTQEPPVSFLSRMLELWLQWAPGDGRGSKNFATFEDLHAALLRVDGIAARAYDLEQAIS